MSTEKAKTGAQAGDAKRTARLAAVQMLYQMEYGQENREGLHLEDGESATAPHGALLKEIVLTVTDRKTTIDDILRQSLDPEWPLERLEVVLRAILRAGVAELLAGNRTPGPILISDYVDVAHAFFAGKEPGLVNAVLDKVAKLVRT